MKKDTQITEVVFRVYKSGFDKGEILALFPYSIATGRLVDCYQFCGQHGSANYDHCVNMTRLATEEEAADMKKHLEEHFGYNLKVVKRRNYNKYLDAYDKSYQMQYG